MSSRPSVKRKERPPRRGLAALLVGLGVVGVALADPMPFRQYPGVEYYDFELPTDFRQPAEWVFGRLMYPSVGFGGQWKLGSTSWTIDYPRGDRHIAALVRRLSIIDARSVEQPVNLEDDDDVFNWPWLYAVEVGQWDLSEEQAAKLREYLLRGGFLMVDDFHGTEQWAIFVESMRRVFPDRPIVDLPDDDPIFHTFWDLVDRKQIPGLQFLYSGRTYEDNGFDAHWRAIYDDQGRVMVAICHNMDLGDAVEHSDTRTYPEEYSATAMRTFLNYIVYAMTH
ncbi:MAG TPA: DUF4159 domain-containing protein [Gammaproteobacteria bacterium]|nr:DUF4159 domain-containing protein [Gammaproteobacteria bacterium]